MVNISNADRDKIVEFLRAYASLIRGRGMKSTKEYNQQRMACNLAQKLERKKTNIKS